MTTYARHRAMTLVITLVLLLCACHGSDSRTGPSGQDSPPAGADRPPTTDQPSSPPQDGRSVTLAFAGDVHFEGGVAELLNRPDATLGPLSEALSTADVAVVNLESALTSGGARVEKELEDPDRRYWFRSPPAALDLLARSGVDAVSLANNHGADYGVGGLNDTLQVAEDSPVAVIGVGGDPDQAFQPYRTSVDGIEVAVLAADASPLESNASIWDVGPDGPGLARAGPRLLAEVRTANASSDIVAVYLHWGAEKEQCPTADQRELAQALADAGADVVVGTHAHLPLGSGMLDDTYISYGLGNFLWYHGLQSATGVLRVQLTDGDVVGDAWIPGEIAPAGGAPQRLSGSARADAIRDWRELRGCTDLMPGPSDRPAAGGDSNDDRLLPPYVGTVEALPTAVRQRMIGSSHTPERCPVRLADLRLLTLRHLGFDGRAQIGQLVAHRRHADDLITVFRDLYEAGFPIERMQLVDDFGGDDNRSMAANNSSAYNCRTVAGQQNFSDHAYGSAVDLNPVQNPYLTGDSVRPDDGRRFVGVDRSAGSEADPGVIVADDAVVRAFERVGWSWGGSWNEPDYQHFHAR